MLRARANRTDPKSVAGSHDFQDDDPSDLPKALLYVNIRAARTHGMKAMACILVLCPTWIICRLYEQNVTAIAPPIARSQFTPMESIRRKEPRSDTNR